MPWELPEKKKKMLGRELQAEALAQFLPTLPILGGHHHRYD